MMLAGGRDKFFQSQLDAYSMFPRPFTEPDEIAAAIVFLMKNSMMNNFHLKVDAGWKQLSSWAAGDRKYTLFALLTNSPQDLSATRVSLGRLR